MNEDTTNRYRIIENSKNLPEEGWVVVESTLFFVKGGYIKRKYGLAGESREELILSAQQFCPNDEILYDDIHKYFHAETSWIKKYLAPYDADLYPDSNDDD